MKEKIQNAHKYKGVEAYGNAKLIIIFFIIGLFVGAFIALFYNQQQLLTKKALEQAQLEQLSGRPITEKVQEILGFIPKGKPVLAAVRDISVYKNKPEYQFAKNGDKVLLYDDVFILFDDTTGKIVSAIPRAFLDGTMINNNVEENSEQVIDGNDNVNNVDNDETGRDITKPLIAPQDITVEVRNGGVIRGFAGVNADQIKTDFGYATIASNASRNTYSQVLLIDLTKGDEKYKEITAQLQKKYAINEVLTTLPAGEAESSAQYVLIVVK